ncbi:MAG: redoxin domain-containing protein [Chloroflexi bacterium]|nr:redoxin domain-containing protein [Chloroflexota bacterium]
MKRREERAPNVGDEAPDFELPVLDGKGATVRLSELRGRPVALIFGSYT